MANDKTPTITAFLADEGDGGHVGITFSYGTGICERLTTFFDRTEESDYKDWANAEAFHRMRENVLYVAELQKRAEYAEKTLEYRDKQLREANAMAEKYRNLYANATTEKEGLIETVERIQNVIKAVSNKTMDSHCCRPLVDMIAEGVNEQVLYNRSLPFACKPDLSEGL